MAKRPGGDKNNIRSHSRFMKELWQHFVDILLFFFVPAEKLSKWHGSGRQHVTLGDGTVETCYDGSPQIPFVTMISHRWAHSVDIHGGEHGLIAHAGPRTGSFIRTNTVCRNVMPGYTTHPCPGALCGQVVLGCAPTWWTEWSCTV